MRKCMINWISLSFVGVGCFLLGGATGLALSKDEEDIWADDAIKLDDIEYDVFAKPREITREEYEDLTSNKNEYKNIINELNYYGSNPEDIDNEDDIPDNEEVINTTPYDIDLDGDTIQVKNTSEGIVEVTEPYIISEEEFSDPNVFGEFEQNTLIYYEEDDVLTTDRDEVITNVDELIGSEALNNFGHLSGNKDTVFVRNIKLGSNFEIFREKDSYQSVVLGLDDNDYEKAKKFFDELENDNG